MDDWGVRVGMTALLGKGQTLLHAGVSRRGRFPALREAYSEALNRFEPNPDLHPERLVAWEGGVTTRVGRGELQLVAFHHELSDAIRRITLPNKKRKRVNSDQLTSTGAELLFSQLVGSVEMGGDLILQSVELKDPANPVSREPENLPDASGGAYVRLPVLAGIHAHAEVRYTGPQFSQNPDTGADVELAGGTLFGGTLSRSWAVRQSRGGMFSKLEAAVGVDNLTDKALYDQYGLPRPGRLLRMQLKLF
jgi:iron complex outermembrane receptor protein